MIPTRSEIVSLNGELGISPPVCQVHGLVYGSRLEDIVASPGGEMQSVNCLRAVPADPMSTECGPSLSDVIPGANKRTFPMGSCREGAGHVARYRIRLPPLLVWGLWGSRGTQRSEFCRSLGRYFSRAHSHELPSTLIMSRYLKRIRS